LCCRRFPFALRLEAFRTLYNFRQTTNRDIGLQSIEKAVEIDPDDPMNLYVHQKIGPRRGGPESNPILRALRISPDLAIIQYEAGNQFLTMRSLPEARAAFERAIELSPRHFRSYVGLARTMSRIDEDYDVEPLYKRVVDIAPGFLEGRLLLGDYYAGMLEADLAAEQYRAIISRNPKVMIAHVKLAFLFLEARRLDEAEKAAVDAIAVEPQAYEAYYCLGNVWYERGDLDRAQAEYERALKIVPIYPDAMYGLGTVHFEKNRPVSLEVEEFLVDGPGRARVQVRIVGEHGLPLRFWDTVLDREDRWERVEGQWWVIPGKL